MTLSELIENLSCEDCHKRMDKREIYVYLDLGAWTRVKCEDHHEFEDGKPYYGARNLKEFLSQFEPQS